MRYGIVGDPVSHSLSPAIHTAGFRIRNIEASFEFIPTPSDGFETDRVLECFRRSYAPCKRAVRRKQDSRCMNRVQS